MALENNNGISCKFGTTVQSSYLLPPNKIKPSDFSLQLVPCLYFRTFGEE